MARAAYLLALSNPHISASIVEVTEFEELGQKYQVRAVPTTVISDKIMFPGNVPQTTLMDVILQTVEGTIAVEPQDTGGETTAMPPPQQRGERRTPGGLILP
jgi:hypothetical protein